MGTKSFFAATFGVLCLLACASFAQEKADTDLNTVFAFKKVFVAPAQDNVEGAYVQPVSEAFARIFERNPRFEVVDKAEQSDTIVQAKINKKTNGTDLSITLWLNPSKEIFVTENSSIRNDVTGGELVESLKQLLKTALKRIPFYGTVTGRDGEQVTFDIGTAQGLQTGDIVQIARIDRVKRHPLLKTIVDVDLVPVGSVEVTQVEDAIAFGKVHNVIAGENILRMYKVTAIESRPSKDLPRAPEDKVQSVNSVSRSADEDDERPKIGYVGLGMFVGGFSSSSSANGGASNFSGSAFAPGAQVTGELWITKNWFADLGLGYNFMTFSQASVSDSTNVSPETSQTTHSFALNFGYKYLLRKSIFGPQFFVKIGYRNFSWDAPLASNQLLFPKSYSGFNLGIGGSVPVSGQDFGILTSLNVILFGSLDESGNRTGPGDSSMSAVNFFIGGYHFLNTKLAVRAGFFFDSYSADFNGDSTTFANTSQKQVGFLPSILYYF